MRLEVDAATIGPQDASGVASAGLYGSHSRVSGAETGGRDSAEISGTSQLISAASSERSARIAQLAAAVQGGTYSVSGSAISQAVVAEAAAPGSTGGAQR